MLFEGEITEVTISGKTLDELNAAEVLKNCEVFVARMADLKPRALASFPEVATAGRLKLINWKALTEKKEWPLLEYKTVPFTFDYIGDFMHAAAEKESEAQVRDRIRNAWRKTPSDPIDDIKAAAEAIRKPKKALEPRAPSDAVPIAGGVELRPFKFEIDRVEVLKKGDVTDGGFFGPYEMRSGEVRVHFIVPDRSNGMPLKLFYRVKLNDELVNQDQTYLPRMIRHALRCAYMHEVDEMLYLDGERFTEPHPETHERNPGGRFRAAEDDRHNRQAVARIEELCLARKV